MRKRTALVLAAITAAALLVIPGIALGSHTFVDVPDSNVFHDDIDWMAENRITLGCNPPANDEFCPSENVRRETMAAFMRRLAENQVVDAGTLQGKTAAELSVPGPQGPKGDDAELGPTADTIMGGSAWVPLAGASATYNTGATALIGSGAGVSASMPLVGPSLIGETEYPTLLSVEYCVESVANGGFVNSARIDRTNPDGSFVPNLKIDFTNRTAQGCYEVSANIDSFMGVALVITTGDDAGSDGTVTLGGVKATWSVNEAP